MDCKSTFKCWLWAVSVLCVYLCKHFFRLIIHVLLSFSNLPLDVQCLCPVLIGCSVSVPSVGWMFSVCVQCWLDVQSLCPVLVGCLVSVPSVGWMFSVYAQCWLDVDAALLTFVQSITAIQLRYCVFVMACNALICVCYRNIHHSISNQSEIPSPWHCDVPYLSKILLLPLLFRFLCFPSFPSFPALRT